DRRHVAEKANRVLEVELASEVLEPVLEHAPPGDVEPRVGPLVEHAPEGTQKHDVTLDRDQATDAEEARRVAVVRLRLGLRRDPVVDDLEVRLREALGLGEVAGETA